MTERANERFAPSAILGLTAAGLAAGPWLSCAVGMQQYPAARRSFGVLGLLASMLGGMLFAMGWRPAAPILITGVSLVMLWLDSRPSNQHPMRWCALPLGSLVATSFFVEIAQTIPEHSAILWRVIGTNETIEEAQWCLALSTVSFGFGMMGLIPGAEVVTNAVAGFFSRIREGATENQIDRGVLLFGMGAFVITTSIQGASYVSTSFVSLDYASVLGAFSYLYYVAMYAAAFRMLRARRANWWVIGWLVGTLGMLILSGSKGRFFTWWIQPLFLVYLLERRRLSPRVAVGALAILLLSATVIYPTLVAYRSDLARGESRDEVASLVRASGRHEEDLIDKMLVPITEGYVAEQALALSSIVHFHPSRPPERLFSRMIGFWVPRFVWSTKPEAINTNELGRETMRVGPDDNVTSVLSTAPGELFAYLGIVGMLLMAVTGFVCRTIERAVGMETGTALGAGAVALFSRDLPTVISGGFEAELTGWIQRGFALAIVFLFVAWSSRGRHVGSIV